jgi:hypothetical protein
MPPIVSIQRPSAEEMEEREELRLLPTHESGLQGSYQNFPIDLRQPGEPKVFSLPRGVHILASVFKEVVSPGARGATLGPADWRIDIDGDE